MRRTLLTTHTASQGREQPETGGQCHVAVAVFVCIGSQSSPARRRCRCHAGCGSQRGPFAAHPVLGLRLQPYYRLSWCRSLFSALFFGPLYHLRHPRRSVAGKNTILRTNLCATLPIRTRLLNRYSPTEASAYVTRHDT